MRLNGRSEYTEEWTGWFSNEQLSDDEKWKCESMLRHYDGPLIDFVLTHTCPLKWMPNDAFIPIVDSSSVDHGMELFLERIEELAHYKIWLFGHYHLDRLERPCVQSMFKAIENTAVTRGQYSFEERMGCGFGACMGCSCKTLTGYKRICKEGPVMMKEEILWED